ANAGLAESTSVAFQLAEVEVARNLFWKFPRRFDDSRPRPAPVRAGEIHGGVRDDGENWI
ncbi:MAG TPA: hypothetical protein QGG32_10080, partial [Rhodospirillales bacterium]|nr:hypothetical protein [Rhodospirillales bacterium]